VTIYAPAYRGLTAGVLATVLLVAFEALAVTTVMPVTARALGGLSLYAWAFSGFFAASLVGMVVAGELCDVLGPRLPFLAGVGGFVVGLVVAGLAPSMPVLVAGRVVQGLGAGALIVALYVIVANAYPADLRPQAFGVMATGWVVPSLVGPVLAGWVAEQWSWRLVFLAVPVLVVPSVGAMLPRLVRLDKQRGAGGLPGLPRNGRKRRALAAAAGLVVLQYAGQHLAWTSLVAVAVAAALLVPSLPALLPAGTLRLARGLPAVVAQRGLLMGSLVGTEAFLPLMLVNERGLSPSHAGTVLTGAALSWSFGSWWQGRERTRVPRWALVRAGGVLLAAGIAVSTLALWSAVTPYVAVVGWTVAGLGMGLAVASISVSIFRTAPADEHGRVSAAVQISDALGCVVYVAVAGALFAGLHARPGQDTAAFLVIFAVMGTLAAASAVLAGRMRTRAPEAAA